MHVAIVTNALFPDHNMFAREQSAALVELGHRVTVFARAGHRPQWPHPVGVEVIEAHWEEDFDRFQQAVREVRPDILHIQERRGCGPALHLGVPTVVEITSISLRPAPLRHLALARKMWELRGEHPVGTANRALIGPLRPADFYAPNGYSSWAPEVAAIRDHHPPDSQMTIYQGTFDRLRRLDRMIASFALVAERVPSATLRCVGGRDAADRERLVSHARRLGVAERIEVVGRVGPNELIGAMAAAALAVSWIPSSTGFQHQPPLKVLDAQAAAVPVLATPTAATHELLRAGGGRLAPPRIGRFAEAWITMLLEAERGKGARLRDRDRFLEDRSWRCIVRDYWIPRYRSQTGLSERSRE